MRKEKHFEERTSIFTNVSVQDELKKVRDSSQNSDHLAGSSKFGSIRPRTSHRKSASVVEISGPINAKPI
jgi:hypothetical protein